MNLFLNPRSIRKAEERLKMKDQSKTQTVTGIRPLLSSLIFNLFSQVSP